MYRAPLSKPSDVRLSDGINQSIESALVVWSLWSVSGPRGVWCRPQPDFDDDFPGIKRFNGFDFTIKPIPDFTINPITRFTPPTVVVTVSPPNPFTLNYNRMTPRKPGLHIPHKEFEITIKPFTMDIKGLGFDITYTPVPKRLEMDLNMKMKRRDPKVADKPVIIPMSEKSENNEVLRLKQMILTLKSQLNSYEEEISRMKATTCPPPIPSKPNNKCATNKSKRLRTKSIEIDYIVTESDTKLQELTLTTAPSPVVTTDDMTPKPIRQTLKRQLRRSKTKAINYEFGKEETHNEMHRRAKTKAMRDEFVRAQEKHNEMRVNSAIRSAKTSARNINIHAIETPIKPLIITESEHHLTTLSISKSLNTELIESTTTSTVTPKPETTSMTTLGDQTSTTGTIGLLAKPLKTINSKPRIGLWSNRLRKKTEEFEQQFDTNEETKTRSESAVGSHKTSSKTITTNYNEVMETSTTLSIKAEEVTTESIEKSSDSEVDLTQRTNKITEALIQNSKTENIGFEDLMREINNEFFVHLTNNTTMTSEVNHNSKGIDISTTPLQTNTKLAEILSKSSKTIELNTNSDDISTETTNIEKETKISAMTTTNALEEKHLTTEGVATTETSQLLQMTAKLFETDANTAETSAKQSVHKSVFAQSLRRRHTTQEQKTATKGLRRKWSRKRVSHQNDDNTSNASNEMHNQMKQLSVDVKEYDQQIPHHESNATTHANDVNKESDLKSHLSVELGTKSGDNSHDPNTQSNVDWLTINGSVVIDSSEYKLRLNEFIKKRLLKMRSRLTNQSEEIAHQILDSLNHTFVSSDNNMGQSSRVKSTDAADELATQSSELGETTRDIQVTNSIRFTHLRHYNKFLKDSIREFNKIYANNAMNGTNGRSVGSVLEVSSSSSSSSLSEKPSVESISPETVETNGMNSSASSHWATETVATPQTSQSLQTEAKQSVHKSVSAQSLRRHKTQEQKTSAEGLRRKWSRKRTSHQNDDNTSNASNEMHNQLSVDVKGHDQQMPHHESDATTHANDVNKDKQTDIKSHISVELGTKLGDNSHDTNTQSKVDSLTINGSVVTESSEYKLRLNEFLKKRLSNMKSRLTNQSEEIAHQILDSLNHTFVSSDNNMGQSSRVKSADAANGLATQSSESEEMTRDIQVTNSSRFNDLQNYNKFLKDSMREFNKIYGNNAMNGTNGRSVGSVLEVSSSSSSLSEKPSVESISPETIETNGVNSSASSHSASSHSASSDLASSDSTSSDSASSGRWNQLKSKLKSMGNKMINESVILGEKVMETIGKNDGKGDIHTTNEHNRQLKFKKSSARRGLSPTPDSEGGLLNAMQSRRNLFRSQHNTKSIVTTNKSVDPYNQVITDSKSETNQLADSPTTTTTTTSTTSATPVAQSVPQFNKLRQFMKRTVLNVDQSNEAEQSDDKNKLYLSHVNIPVDQSGTNAAPNKSPEGPPAINQMLSGLEKERQDIKNLVAKIKDISHNKDNAQLEADLLDRLNANVTQIRDQLKKNYPKEMFASVVKPAPHTQTTTEVPINVANVPPPLKGKVEQLIKNERALEEEFDDLEGDIQCLAQIPQSSPTTTTAPQTTPASQQTAANSGQSVTTKASAHKPKGSAFEDIRSVIAQESQQLIQSVSHAHEVDDIRGKASNRSKTSGPTLTELKQLIQNESKALIDSGNNDISKQTSVAPVVTTYAPQTTSQTTPAHNNTDHSADKTLKMSVAANNTQQGITTTPAPHISTTIDPKHALVLNMFFGGPAPPNGTAHVIKSTPVASQSKMEMFGPVNMKALTATTTTAHSTTPAAHTTAHHTNASKADPNHPAMSNMFFGGPAPALDAGSVIKSSAVAAQAKMSMFGPTQQTVTTTPAPHNAGPTADPNHPAMLNMFFGGPAPALDAGSVIKSSAVAAQTKMILNLFFGEVAPSQQTITTTPAPQKVTTTLDPKHQTVLNLLFGGHPPANATSTLDPTQQTILNMLFGGPAPANGTTTLDPNQQTILNLLFGGPAPPNATSTLDPKQQTILNLLFGGPAPPNATTTLDPNQQIILNMLFGVPAPANATSTLDPKQQTILNMLFGGPAPANGTGHVIPAQQSNATTPAPPKAGPTVDPNHQTVLNMFFGGPAPAPDNSSQHVINSSPVAHQAKMDMFPSATTTDAHNTAALSEEIKKSKEEFNDLSNQIKHFIFERQMHNKAENDNEFNNIIKHLNELKDRIRAKYSAVVSTPVKHDIDNLLLNVLTPMVSPLRIQDKAMPYNYRNSIDGFDLGLRNGLNLDLDLNLDEVDYESHHYPIQKSTWDYWRPRERQHNVYNQLSQIESHRNDGKDVANVGCAANTDTMTDTSIETDSDRNVWRKTRAKKRKSNERLRNLRISQTKERPQKWMNRFNDREDDNSFDWKSEWKPKPENRITGKTTTANKYQEINPMHMPVMTNDYLRGFQ
ncbi:unnamed protein product [Medioppia subpectinata]|uniref:Uncharacterized protein n=1 Tax=Medioppia subpectinata TaxID=1979941 RepID=A0A7R9KGA5_9ACAR|nr:unnamed protein product [Medioppia subpectinata]CAG2102034.1 unnamed protein product [Medioppia subpectinata]